MGFKELLIEKLKGKVDDDKLGLLPKGFQKIGDIVILNLHEELVGSGGGIGKAVLEIFPQVRSVCNKIGGVIGKFRQPQVKVIAGSKDTETTHMESGCRYKFDVCKLMFAKGNVVERVRIAKQVGRGEVIVDMFAGLGYFTVPIGKLSKAKKIYAIELNPDAFYYLKENLKINHIHNVEVFNNDNREIISQLAEKDVKADRVIMGYLPPPKEFLESAMKIVKSGSIIHYEDLVIVGKEDEEIKRVMKEIETEAGKVGRKAKLLLARKIKSYGPKFDHYVFVV
jgi:tRNA wybutosine-synthesizing protein 2